MMLEKNDEERFRVLSRSEEEGTLTEPERAELTLLIQKIEKAEAEYLKPATERLDREHKTMQAQNRTLEALIQRKESLIQRLEATLAEAQAERSAIAQELEHILPERTAQEIKPVKTGSG